MDRGLLAKDVDDGNAPAVMAAQDNRGESNGIEAAFEEGGYGRRDLEQHHLVSAALPTSIDDLQPEIRSYCPHITTAELPIESGRVHRRTR